MKKYMITFWYKKEQCYTVGWWIFKRLVKKKVWKKKMLIIKTNKQNDEEFSKLFNKRIFIDMLTIAFGEISMVQLEEITEQPTFITEPIA